MRVSKPTYNWQSATVDPVIGGSFFAKAVDLINQAASSVCICVFTARYYRGKSRNPVNELFDALRRAANRGVAVRMLLNQNFYDHEASQHNVFIAKYFKARNLEAAMGGASTRIHSKLILIDEHITVIGSHNYSARAHRTNFETSVIIKSDEINAYFKKEFERLWAVRKLITGRIER